jgi:uncharacterized protein DUF6356
MTVSSPGLIGTSRAHLAQVGETYWEHMAFALAVGSMLAAAGLACMLHALLPAVCRDTASGTIGCLHRVVEDRTTLDDATAEAAEAVAFAMLLSMSLAVAMMFWIVGAQALVAVAMTLLAMALPAAFLVSNPDLKSEAARVRRNPPDPEHKR